MVAQSGGEVNRLLDWRLVERFPAIDAAHDDLPRGYQGPAQHGRRFRVGQRALGLHPALELPVQAKVQESLTRKPELDNPTHSI